MVKTSFIIIAYNEERTISRCLDSILAQNDLSDYEIIVVDDGSKDETVRVVEKYVKNNSKIVLRRLIPNQGRGGARAEGVKNAQGEYVAFIDADIVLPNHWLSTCYSHIVEYDAVGGIAVPDGDVNYLYVLLDLKPKVANPTTVVSGSNGFYKRELFEKISFNKDFRDGEDSVFNKLMIVNGFKIFLIKSLIVEHREGRKLLEALKWLYQIGRGATRQFKQFKEIRLPDIAYFALVAVFLSAIVLSVFFKTLLFFLIPIAFILLVDIVHIRKKFFFEIGSFLKYIAGIVVYWLMLSCYFIGRTTGWFIPVPKVEQKKQVMLCFDFEGKRGMPFEAAYDIKKTTYSILSVLDKYNAKIVFFVAGELIEEYPGLIREISKHGHEIALHGYLHNHIDTYTESQMEIFSNDLLRIGKNVKLLTGKKLTGFRSPFLMNPVFYSPELYKVLKKHNYKWVSNRSIRHEREFFKFRVVDFLMKSKMVRSFLFILLNWRFIVVDFIDINSRFRIFTNLKWLLRGSFPYIKYGLLEIPAHAPFDSELVGLPYPNEPTKQKTLDWAVNVFISNAFDSKGVYTITFHDWITGTSNRIQILDRVLSKLSKEDRIKFFLPGELI